ncbi:MAG: SMI1/KNR4 family protein [Chitinophagaceae bacterium]|nr:SMI1/KNR4 family protein [Chitinophagaceae bacterium]
MKGFNFFKRKAHKEINRFDEPSVNSDLIYREVADEKPVYDSDTTLLSVLDYIRDNSAALGVYLNKPANDLEIESFENQKGKLPHDFKLLYRFSNGFETDHDLFRFIPLEEISKNEMDKSFLICDNSFHFCEYMIYSDIWSVEINNENINEYRIYNKAENVVFLTNSLAEFLCVFFKEGIYDGLYGWRESIEKSVNKIL